MGATRLMGATLPELAECKTSHEDYALMGVPQKPQLETFSCEANTVYVSLDWDSKGESIITLAPACRTTEARISFWGTKDTLLLKLCQEGLEAKGFHTHTEADGLFKTVLVNDDAEIHND